MSEGTCDVNMFDNTGVTFRPPEKLREKLEKHYKEAMKLNFDEVFERNEDGKMTCKIDPNLLKEGEYQYTIHEVMQNISNEHRKILDEWCKAYLAKEYEIGNDIHPGCFTIEQREVRNPNQCGWDYMIVPNDQNLGTRVEWKSIEDQTPPDGKFIIYSDGILLHCVGRYCANEENPMPSSTFLPWSRAKYWMLLPEPPIKTPRWKQLGWCCENLYNSTNKEYSMDSGYPENAPMLMDERNQLYIGKIDDRIEFCPWCGKEVNNG